MKPLKIVLVTSVFLFVLFSLVLISGQSVNTCPSGKILTCPQGYSLIDSSMDSTKVNQYERNDCVSGKEFSQNVPYRGDGRKVCRSISQETVPIRARTTGPGVCTDSIDITASGYYTIIEGACVDETPSTCTESDVSNNIYIKGSVTKDTFTITDTCLGENLLQHACSIPSGETGWSSLTLGDAPAGLFFKTYTCTNGCLDGACVLESCTSIGEVDYESNTYCSFDKKVAALEEDGQTCVNDFECISQTCSEGICGGRYGTAGFGERTNLLYRVMNYLNGEECLPGEESCDSTNYLVCGIDGKFEDKGPINGKCGFVSLCTPGEEGCSGTEGTVYMYCNADGVWENQGMIPGECNYNPPITCSANSCIGTTFLECVNGVYVNRGNVDGQCGYQSGGGGGGGGGGRSRTCRVSWNCTEWSDTQNNCGSRICRDMNECRRSETKPAERVTCPGVTPFCGDGVCNTLVESTITCGVDCPAPPVRTECGNGVCESDESSNTCSEDCVAEKPKSRWWIFWLIVFILLILIIVIILAIKKLIKKKNEEVNVPIKKESPVPNQPKIDNKSLPPQDKAVKK